MSCYVIVLAILCVFVSVSATNVPASSDKLSFTVDPISIKTGLNATASFSITCSHIASGNVKSISLGRKCGEEKGARMAIIRRSNNELVVSSTKAPEGAVFTASIDDKTINMLLEAPTSEDACIYACHATQGSHHFWAYVDVPETETTLPELIEGLLAAEAQITIIEGQVAALEAAIMT